MLQRKQSVVIRAPNFHKKIENVTKLFWCNYVAISVASVKIKGKYAASDVNYAKKVL